MSRSLPGPAATRPDECYRTKSIKCAPKMPLLHPLRLWPRRHAHVAEALLALDKIERVELMDVRKVHGMPMLVLGIYLKRQPSRIPTNRQSRSCSTSSRDMQEELSREPDYQLEKSIHELQMLRYHAAMYAQQAVKDTCELCSAFVALTCSQHSHAKLLTLLWPRFSTRKRTVDGFLNDLVGCCLDGLHTIPRSPYCKSFDHIPLRVYRFLASPLRIS